MREGKQKLQSQESILLLPISSMNFQMFENLIGKQFSSINKKQKTSNTSKTSLDPSSERGGLICPKVAKRGAGFKNSCRKGIES